MLEHVVSFNWYVILKHVIQGRSFSLSAKGYDLTVFKLVNALAHFVLFKNSDIFKGFGT